MKDFTKLLHVTLINVLKEIDDIITSDFNVNGGMDMTKEQISAYTMRISQANASAMAVVLFDIVLECIGEAKQAFAEKNPAQFQRSLSQAQGFLQELMSMSKMDSQVGCDVMSIYLFVDKQMLMSIVKQQPVNLEECAGYLEQLRSSFVEISKKDSDAPLMQGSQQVYAGLTYGKGYLNESCDPLGAHNRGLQA